MKLLENQNGPIRVAASTSLVEAEVQVLDEIFAALRRGGDVRVLLRSEAARGVLRKLEVMKKTIARQKALRAQRDARRPGHAPGQE